MKQLLVAISIAMMSSTLMTAEKVVLTEQERRIARTIAQECFTLSQTKEGCANLIAIGRLQAINDLGYLSTPLPKEEQVRYADAAELLRLRYVSSLPSTGLDMINPSTDKLSKIPLLYVQCGKTRVCEELGLLSSHWNSEDVKRAEMNTQKLHASSPQMQETQQESNYVDAMEYIETTFNQATEL